MLTIRRAATLEDAEGILEIDQVTFKECTDSPAEILSNLCDRYPAYIAWQGPLAVGYICLMQVRTLHYRACWVDLVAVRPDHQGQGIAKALIAQGLAHAHETGAEFLSALVRKGNDPSFGAFRHEGFEAVGEGFDLMVCECDPTHKKMAGA